MKNNPGISETLGAILMIAVFVAGFGILGVVYFSQPPPEKIPSVTFDLKLGDGSAIYLGTQVATAYVPIIRMAKMPKTMQSIIYLSIKVKIGQ